MTLRFRNVGVDEALAALARAYDLQVRRDGTILLVGAAGSMNRRFGNSDQPLATRTTVFALHNARPEELVKPLTDALAPGTIVVADKRTASILITGSQATIDRARALVVALDGVSADGTGTHSTRALPLRHLRATDAMRLLKGFLTDGSVAADDRQNAILVTGTTEVVAAARALLVEIDRPAAQVLFEVKVIDVTPQNDVSNVGVQFGGVDFTGEPLTGSTTYAFARNSLQINARLNFLVSRGNAKILATPRLVTLNNREASLLIGQTYPIIYFDIRSGNQQIQNIDIGVKLRMTPTIGADGSITAELHPEYSEIQSFVQNYPIVANRKIDSTLHVRDGETIVLGGLLRDVSAETVTKLPILGNIPV
ncbi:MAG: type II secretion system protein GspD, partial [Candidatus Eremiobacteraeota bacterium]|nr:type II secretion system protein GspD [Candidatus Eremiobacteraeota bacterium]